MRGERLGGWTGRAGDANLPAICAGPAEPASPGPHQKTAPRVSRQRFDEIARPGVCPELYPGQAIVPSARSRPGAPSARAAWPPALGRRSEGDRATTCSAYPRGTQRGPAPASLPTLEICAALCCPMSAWMGTGTGKDAAAGERDRTVDVPITDRYKHHSNWLTQSLPGNLQAFMRDLPSTSISQCVKGHKRLVTRDGRTRLAAAMT